VSTAVVVVGLVCGGMTMYVAAMAAVLRKRGDCPTCRKRGLRLVSLTRGIEWPPSGRPADFSMHRCDACGAEFGRQGNGPFVPKEAWDAGARGEFPTAVVVPPRKPPTESR
jgi:hypothetical protein